jgi:hypothetical protein
MTFSAVDWEEEKEGELPPIVQPVIERIKDYESLANQQH